MKWITAYHITPETIQRWGFYCWEYGDPDHVWQHAQEEMEANYGHRNVTGWSITKEVQP